MRKRTNRNREFVLLLLVVVASVFTLGFKVGTAAGAENPPTLHLGPPATAAGVACSRVTFHDLVRERSWTIELCYRTRPASVRVRS